jgi:hypothetical protein
MPKEARRLRDLLTRSLAERSTFKIIESFENPFTYEDACGRLYFNDVQIK